MSEKLQSDLHYLDPKRTRVTRDAFGTLSLTAGDTCYEKIRPVLAFPLTGHDHNISLIDAEGKEIGLVSELRALDAESRRILAEELKMLYFTPRVCAILGVLSRYGVTTWKLETDRGYRVAQVKDRSDIRPLPDGRIMLTDAHGIKYEIPNAAQLDERSRYFLDTEG